jgi:hypothetical protein
MQVSFYIDVLSLDTLLDSACLSLRVKALILHVKNAYIFCIKHSYASFCVAQNMLNTEYCGRIANSSN